MFIKHKAKKKPKKPQTIIKKKTMNYNNVTFKDFNLTRTNRENDR